MWFQKKQNKYKNVSSFYNGILYHSKKEAGYAQELDLRKKAMDIIDWTRQIKVSLDIERKDRKPYHICNYYVDFLIHHKDGTEEFVEIKGFETEVWRLKRKLFEALYLESHPEAIYTVVK